MKVNGMEIVGDSFAYDGCHKIYVIENETDKEEALEGDYEIYPINQLEDKYRSSCGLQFISSWSSNKSYVAQSEYEGQWEKIKFED